MMIGYFYWSLGHMGGAQALCEITGFNKEKETPQTLSCPAGYISLDAKSDKTGERIFDAGIIP